MAVSTLQRRTSQLPRFGTSVERAEATAAAAGVSGFLSVFRAATGTFQHDISPHRVHFLSRPKQSFLGSHNRAPRCPAPEARSLLSPESACSVSRTKQFSSAE